MLTIKGLKELGADVDSGFERCMKNEGFYLKMVGMALADAGYANLRTAVEAGDLEKGFEYAHALKGMLGNVSLTNLLAPILEMTEALRAREQRDYAPLLDQMDAELEKLRAL
ncbi:MAG: Hpt domain-containing protein [Eubacterium sp.]|nr:Hpt domain-containing protein [Eubacterium sp.]